MFLYYHICMSIVIIKSTGEKEEFKPEKIKATCLRIGTSSEVADRIAQAVASKARDGMTTKEIYGIVFDLLKQENPGLASRYNLREALFRLGPAGFNFEFYIAEVLKAYGYKAELPDILRGACIQHEVDVVAEKNNRYFMIECKWRKTVEHFITAKDVLSTWARFLDLIDGSAIKLCPHFDELWIITNSRFSHDASHYAQCKNIAVLSWNYPPDRPLPAWIDAKGLYPITALFRLGSELIPAFVEAKIMLVRDVAELSLDELKTRTKLSEKTLHPLIEEAKGILTIH